MAAISELRLAMQDATRDLALAKFQVFSLGDSGEAALQRLGKARARLEDAEAALRAAGPNEEKARLGGRVSAGGMMGGETTGLDAVLQLRLDPIPTAVAHLMTPADWPLVEVTLKNVGDDVARVRVTTWIEGYTAPFVESVEIPAGEEAPPIRHLPTFFPSAIAATVLTEATRATVRVRVEHLDTEKVEVDQSWTTLLLPRSTTVRAMSTTSGAWLDVSGWLAAWVTPNTPEVLRLLREAAERAPSAQIVGYLRGELEVQAQVQAIYEAVKARDLVYINSILVSGAAAHTAAQRVRTPREALETRSANCLDGTVLMASVLEAASLSAAIAICPGHAFLAWESLSDSDDWRYLETTMLATHSFADAMAEGQKQADKAIAAKEFQLIKVRAQRAAGVIPVE